MKSKRKVDSAQGALDSTFNKYLLSTYYVPGTALDQAFSGEITWTEIPPWLWGGPWETKG